MSKAIKVGDATFLKVNDRQFPVMVCRLVHWNYPDVLLPVASPVADSPHPRVQRRAILMLCHRKAGEDSKAPTNDVPSTEVRHKELGAPIQTVVVDPGSWVPKTIDIVWGKGDRSARGVGVR